MNAVGWFKIQIWMFQFFTSAVTATDAGLKENLFQTEKKLQFLN
jgi:hypothetical protein